MPLLDMSAAMRQLWDMSPTRIPIEEEKVQKVIERNRMIKGKGTGKQSKGTEKSKSKGKGTDTSGGKDKSKLKGNGKGDHGSGMQGNEEQDQPLPELDGEDLPEDEEDVQTAPAPGSAGTHATAELTADDLQNSHMWEIGDKAHDFKQANKRN